MRTILYILDRGLNPSHPFSDGTRERD